MVAVVIAVLYLGALVIITVEDRRLAGRRHWPAAVTLTAYIMIVLLCSFLLGRS